MKQDRQYIYFRQQTMNFGRNHKVQRTLSPQFGTALNLNQEYMSYKYITTKPKDDLNKHYSNRNSGRINVNSFACKIKEKSQLENIKNQARTQLRKLSYREKLTQIQFFFKTARELCKAYGYFYATFAMVRFTLDQTIKINLWIHPDPRCTKPLHPIKKETNFQCQLDCVGELKKLIKIIFPATDLGNGKTFSNVIAHIEVAEADLDARKRREVKKSTFQNNKTQVIQQYYGNGYQQNQYMAGKVHIKSTPHQFESRFEEETFQCQEKIINYKNDQKKKETMSTLIQSFRSANSVIQRLRNQCSISANSPISPKTKQSHEPLRDYKKSRKGSWISQLKQENNLDLISNQVLQTPPNKDQHKNPASQLTQQNSLRNVKNSVQSVLIKQSLIKMKNSNGGIKRMTMSIEMESQINNLFGSDDLGLNGFYIHNPQKKALKNSILSKVAEQFEDLF